VINFEEKQNDQKKMVKKVGKYELFRTLGEGTFGKYDSYSTLNEIFS
jgi:hypothetical protein